MVNLTCGRFREILNRENMKILGVETSCDETAAAVVENGTKILSNVVASSAQLHKKTGGIIPEVAAREQVKCIIPVIQEAIKLAGGRWRIARGKKTTSYKPPATSQIDAIAVTFGPGLIGPLLVGVETAKTLAFLFKKPIVPVNHLLGHIYANWLSREEKPELPAVALVASGGHTELVLMKDHDKFLWLGGTRDDASGEAFDKIARILGLGFPGGPAIEKKAKDGNPKAFPLPRPMINQENFDFSFSGLKTAVLRLVKSQQCRFDATIVDDNIHLPDLAASVQEAIVDCLVKKTIKAALKYKAKSILLSGGVAANKRLRGKMKLEIEKWGNGEIKLFVPPINLCTDNAAFVASYAFFNFKPIPWEKITPFPSLETCEEFF